VVVDITYGHSTNVGPVAEGDTMTFTGTLTLEGDLNIPDAGKATVHVLVAGAQAASSGDISVDGTGSRLTASGSVTLGESGTGSLTITNTARANLTSLVLGAEANGYGNASVTGAHSELNVKDTVTVGEKGTGYLSVSNGASFDPADVVVAGVGSPTGGPTDRRPPSIPSTSAASTSAPTR